MTESKSTGNYVLNLLIIGVAIILVIVAMQSINNHPPHDSFVGKVPMVPIGNGMQMPYYVPGGYPTGQPMMYPNQIYPAKAPYYNDTFNHIGRPCNQANAENGGSCGVLGTCTNGVCTVKDKHDTVFDLKI